VRALRALGLLLVLACERGGPVATVPPSNETPVGPKSSSTDGVFVTVEGQGSNEDEAYANAVRALATELLGDARWLDVARVELHERTSDLDSERSPSGGVKVRLHVTHSEAAAALAAFREAEPDVTAPEAWRETIVAYLFAHIREHACVRQKALFSVECETGTTGDADAALQTLIGAVALAPALAGGVPLDARGRPLREPGVLALWNGAPASGVPLRVEIDDAITRAHTGDDGRVQLRLPERDAWPRRIRVAIDTESLLGPEHAAWRSAPIDIRSRKIDLRRWTVVIADDAGRAIADAPRAAFVAEMRAAGFGDPKSIKNLGARDLSRVVERTGGEVDMLVVVELRSAYASRMGGGRVWYEASGSVRAVNTWLEKDAVPSFRLDVTASGIGDTRAELAARTKLCEDAAEKLAAALKRES
jgi:hypothetical protein